MKNKFNHFRRTVHAYLSEIKWNRNRLLKKLSHKYSEVTLLIVILLLLLPMILINLMIALSVGMFLLMRTIQVKGRDL